jgi:hypothetical protein
MKRIDTLVITLLLIITATGVYAQEQQQERKRFSPEEFQRKQKEYITEKAELTSEEAEAFFPLFFELQKKKFDLERNARSNIKRCNRESLSEEQCLEFVNNMSDVRIQIATLEKEYTAKYLTVIPARKLLKVQQAEQSFQRDLMREMTRDRGHRNHNINR